MKKAFYFTLTALLLFSLQMMAQDSTLFPVKKEKVTLGIGMGMDYGGLGGNLCIYPQKNIGLFAGGGYALAGFGYNVGIKARIVPADITKRISPFAYFMYGYNAAIAVTNGEQYNKLFYGTSLGLGVDFKSGPQAKGYFSFSLILPFRSDEVDEYFEYLENDIGVEFQSKLLPFGFSLGYKFIL